MLPTSPYAAAHIGAGLHAAGRAIVSAGQGFFASVRASVSRVLQSLQRSPDPQPLAQRRASVVSNPAALLPSLQPADAGVRRDDFKQGADTKDSPSSSHSKEGVTTFHGTSPARAEKDRKAASLSNYAGSPAPKTWEDGREAVGDYREGQRDGKAGAGAGSGKLGAQVFRVSTPEVQLVMEPVRQQMDPVDAVVADSILADGANELTRLAREHPGAEVPRLDKYRAMLGVLERNFLDGVYFDQIPAETREHVRFTHDQFKDDPQAAAAVPSAFLMLRGVPNTLFQRAKQARDEVNRLSAEIAAARKAVPGQARTPQDLQRLQDQQDSAKQKAEVYQIASKLLNSLASEDGVAKKLMFEIAPPDSKSATANSKQAQEFLEGCKVSGDRLRASLKALVA